MMALARGSLGIAAFGVCLVLAPAPSARAVPHLFLSTSTPSILEGETAFIELGITGLDAGTHLGRWKIDIVYDDSVINVPSVAFGSELNVGPPSIQYSLDQSPYVYAEETADPGADLSGQPVSFTLATYSFLGWASGVATVSFDSDGYYFELRDQTLNPLPFTLGGAVQVEVLPVPTEVSDSSVTVSFALFVGLMAILRQLRQRLDRR